MTLKSSPHPLLAVGERSMTRANCPLIPDLGAALSTAVRQHKLLEGRVVFSECILMSKDCTGGNGQLYTAEEAAYHGRQVLSLIHI